MSAFRHSFLITILVTALSGTCFAQAVESEPLPPPPGGTTSSVTPPPASDPGVIPMTTPSGAPVSLGGPPSPGDSAGAPVVSGGDGGMAGGGGSVYDMGVTPSPERSTAPVPYGGDTGSPRNDEDAPTPAIEMVPPRTIPYGSSIGTAPPEKMPAPDKKFCTLEVAFGSRGAGIDQRTAEYIKNYLSSHPDKLTYIRSDWGREGEFSYCLDIAQHRNRAQIYKDLKKMIPGVRRGDSSTGDTTLSGSGFETVTTRK